jgi:hypothetical protein
MSSSSSKPHCCGICGKGFSTNSGQKAHRKAAHKSQANKPKSRSKQKKKKQLIWPTSPPFPDAEGEWVATAECSQMKSFGHFTCDRCPSKWTSAHALRENFGQECKKCASDHFVRPYCMWENDCTYKREEEEEISDDEAKKKPHLAHLCQACRSGHPCTGMLSFDYY